MADADPGPNGEETGRLGDYVTGKVIGGGGMGTVYEARHPRLGKRVALKVVKGSLAGDPIARERFVREAQAVARISHQHVVDVFDLGIDGERAFIVMELLEGETLEALLTRKGRLGVSQAMDLFLPVISAAAAIHETGVVHRDLKPANIMLARRGRVAIEPVVLDFGISRATEATSGEESLTEPHLLVGTLPYLAPEQLRDARAAGPQSDQYALGVMLYECLTGRKPFTGADRYELIHAVMTAEVVAPRAIAGEIPEELGRAVLRAMARRPEARFPSIRAFGSALLSVADRSAWKRWAGEFAGADPAAGDASSTDTVDDVRRPPQITARRRTGTGRWLALAGAALALVAVVLFVRGPASSPAAPPQSPAGALPAPLAKTEPVQTVPATPPPPPATRLAADRPPDVAPVPAKRRVAQERRRPTAPVVAPAGTGTLYVNASPDWAEVTIDGKPAGTTPIVLSNVPAGSHTLEAKALGKQPSMQRSVVVEAGGKARVELDFRKP